jgi:hypothetical protein
MGTDAGGDRRMVPTTPGPDGVEDGGCCADACADALPPVPPEFRNIVNRVGVGGTCAFDTRRISPLLITDGKRGSIIGNLYELAPPIPPVPPWGMGGALWMRGWSCSEV